MSTVRPVIVCGGAGTRLWPASRDTMPKQFTPLIGSRSTFQETVLRFQAEEFAAKPIVVANGAHGFLVEQQLAAIDASATVLLEPIRRDSGPAILAAALWSAREADDELLLVVAADHAIRDPGAFRKTVLGARGAAAVGHIVTFGVEPTHAATEYGYVRPGEAVADGVRAVVSFEEKPDAETALRHVVSGYLWNSGNFLFASGTLVAEYAWQDPGTTEAVRAAVEGGDWRNGAFELEAEAFGRATATSLDYAVLEGTTRAAVAPLACGWSDIGNWDVLWSLSDRGPDGNVRQGDVEVLDSRNCFVSADGPLTSVVGVEDLVVVANRDAVLVADRRRSTDVKALVAQLRKKGRREADSHVRVHRPWGWYEVLDLGERFQVKRIVVRPSGRLSLQSHQRRAEHWVVVDGLAKVTVGDSVRLLGPNEHAFIPLGAVHRLENPGNAPIELIEVQSGTYFGEDDIARFEDVYGRA